MEHFIQIAVFVLIWGMLAASLNLCTGYTGIVSVAQAALFGIGSYAWGITSVRLEAPFWVSLTMAVIAGAVAGVALVIPLLRLKGDALVVVTLAFQGLCFSLFNNLETLTGGPLGLTGIPRPSLGFVSANSDIISALLVTVVFAASIALLYRVLSLPYGRVLIAIRDDEKFAIAMGKDAARYKIQVSAISGAIAGAAGGLYAQYVGFIDPSSFDLTESFSILCIVIIGGAGSFIGPLLGAMFMVLLPDFLLFVGLPSVQASNWRQIVFGVTIGVLMIWRPQGLLGTYEFRDHD